MPMPHPNIGPLPDHPIALALLSFCSPAILAAATRTSGAWPRKVALATLPLVVKPLIARNASNRKRT